MNSFSTFSLQSGLLPLHSCFKNLNVIVIRPPSRLLTSMAVYEPHAPLLSTTVSKNEESKRDFSSFTTNSDLLVVGPGVLGRLVAENWRQEHPDCQVLGQTISTNQHEDLMKMGIHPSLEWTTAIHQYPYVIFCAPPSATIDYPADVGVHRLVPCPSCCVALDMVHSSGSCHASTTAWRAAVSSWNSEGTFLFTSSSGVYDCSDNGSCHEDSPTVPIGKSSRSDVLLEAESLVLEAGGCVLRLAGLYLYKSDRGPHVFWLEKGTADVRPDAILNLIHYEDAASLSVAILNRQFKGRTYLGCDDTPLSRQEAMDLVAKSGKYSKKFGGFTGTSGSLSKRLNNWKTRNEVGWNPKYVGLAHFLGVII